MHTDDQKYGFMREWMMQFAHNDHFIDDWFKLGLAGWDLLQEIPEGDDKDQQNLFEFSSKD